MSATFAQPEAPAGNCGGVYAFTHTHQWHEVGAQQNPNRTWSSLWACDHCPDIAIGDKVGPIPDGYCSCGWVQRKPTRRRCEECRRPLGDRP